MSDKMRVDPKVKGLIFDCDGTLVDSMPKHMIAWREAILSFNVDCDDDYLFSLKGMKEEDIVECYNKKFGLNLNPKDVVSRKLEFFMKYIDSVEEIKAVTDIAREFKGKLPLAVVSGSHRSTVERELRGTGLIDLFDVILTGDDPFKPKPNPEIFFEAARRINVDPEQCQVFEDGDSGLEGARKAGMIATDIRLYL